MRAILTESVNQGYRQLLDCLSKEGVRSKPRGKETWEIQNFLWEIKNPRKRSLEVVGRWKNLGFQLAECIWIMSGKSDLKTLWHYLPNYYVYSDNLLKLAGAYGERLAEWESGDGRKINQFQAAYEKLATSPDTRQAVMIIFDPAKDYLTTHDVPCTNWMHFVLRDGKLNMKVVMRSNDALWGTPYNMFNFMTIQEVMAGWLGVELGTYTHFVSCMHIYLDKLDVMHRLEAQFKKEIDIYDYVKPLDARTPKFDFERTLYLIRKGEGLAATRNASAGEDCRRIFGGIVQPYWKSYAWAIYIYNELKRKNFCALGYLDEVNNEFKYSLLQFACRIMFRHEIDPEKMLKEELKKMPNKLAAWVLENPIKELEAIGMEVMM